MPKKTTKAVVPSRQGTPARVTVDVLAQIPEEEIWLASRKSARTRRAYKTDVQHFVKTLGIIELDELRRVDHRAVMTWERHMREEEGLEASTVRRRLSALSSLFMHLVKFGVATVNPVRDVERLDNIMRLQRALDSLSDDHRLVVLLHDSEGYKLSEIQEITGDPVGTIKSRLHRARARLRAILAADGTISSS